MAAELSSRSVAAQAPLPPAFFTLKDATSGAKCEVTNGGACISDLNYGADVERCTFRAEAAITVSATMFKTAGFGDRITIGGTRYSGTSGPSNVVMAAGETIEWRSDKDTTAGGFVICASPAPPAPPAPPPWPPGQAPPPPVFALTEATAGAKCEITNGGTCISDLNYTNYERCTFRAEAIISVSATTLWMTVPPTQFSSEARTTRQPDRATW